MKIIIDIPTEDYLHMTAGFTIVGRRFQGKRVFLNWINAIVNGIPIPDNETNRMALKALYPDVSEHFFEGYLQEWLDSPYTTEG